MGFLNLKKKKKAGLFGKHLALRTLIACSTHSTIRTRLPGSDLSFTSHQLCELLKRITKSAVTQFPHLLNGHKDNCGGFN